MEFLYARLSPSRSLASLLTFSDRTFSVLLLVGLITHSSFPPRHSWDEKLPQNTIHASDFASALTSAAHWALPLSRSALLSSPAASNLPSTLSANSQIASLESAGVSPAKKEETIKAVVFNVVDDGETTQKDIAGLVQEVVGVKSGFAGSILSGFARLNLKEITEDVNDGVHFSLFLPLLYVLHSSFPLLTFPRLPLPLPLRPPPFPAPFAGFSSPSQFPSPSSDLPITQHLEGWSSLLQSCDPPMSLNVPISPYVPLDLLQPNPISFDSTTLKQLTGWRPKMRLDKEEVRRTVEGFRKEGLWPNAKPQCVAAFFFFSFPLFLR